jgi:hypothetical protein
LEICQIQRTEINKISAEQKVISQNPIIRKSKKLTNTKILTNHAFVFFQTKKTLRGFSRESTDFCKQLLWLVKNIDSPCHL